MSAPRACVTEVGGNTRVATREQHAERERARGEGGGRGGKEERKVVTMAISAPIRNCRRLSGYPFSLTREMSIRFFGYFASENERATGVRAISLPGFLFLYPRIVRQTNVPNISVGPFLPLLPLLLPPLIGRSPLRSPMHLLTLAPGPLARISHITFRILSFSAASPFSSGRFLDLAVA